MSIISTLPSGISFICLNNRLASNLSYSPASNSASTATSYPSRLQCKLKYRLGTCQNAPSYTPILSRGCTQSLMALGVYPLYGLKQWFYGPVVFPWLWIMLITIAKPYGSRLRPWCNCKIVVFAHW